MDASSLIEKVATQRKSKYFRLSPEGAVASELYRAHSFLADKSRLDVAVEVTRAHFAKEAPRLAARYPDFFRNVSTILAGLEAK